MTLVLTKTAADVFNPIDAGGNPRGADMGEAGTWGTEIEIGLTNTSAAVDALKDLVFGTVGVTSALVLTDDHHGKTIFLAGSGFYPVTLGAITIENFRCRLINPSTTRGRSINIDTAFTLYPDQHSDISRDPDGNFHATKPGRWRKGGAVFYTGGGSDSFAAVDGLGWDAPFASIAFGAAAIVNNVDAISGAPLLEIANGSYTETVTLSGQQTGYNYIKLRGQSAYGVTWRPAGGFCLLVGDNAEALIENMDFDNTGGAAGKVALQVHQTGVLDVLSGVGFGNFLGGSHMGMDGGGGSLNLPSAYSLHGSATYHILAAGGGQLTQAGGGTVLVGSGLSFTVFINLVGSGTNLNSAATSYSTNVTGQKYAVSLNASLSSGGTTYPGTTSGATASGGQYL